MKEIINHPNTKKFIRLLICILAALLIFALGMIIGFSKGQFSERWDRHYMEVMGGPRSPFSAFSDTDDRAPSPHGMAGIIVSSNNGQLVVNSPNNTEDVIIVGSSTLIRDFHKQGTTTDVKVGSWITAIGSPDENGRLIATFIRIMPPPPQQVLAPARQATTSYEINNTTK